MSESGLYVRYALLQGPLHVGAQEGRAALNALLRNGAYCLDAGWPTPTPAPNVPADHRPREGRCHLPGAGTSLADLPRYRSGRERQGAPREEGSPLILVDSSGWIEYLANRPKAGRFATYLEGREALLISAIEICEVYKVIRRDLSEERAVEAISALRRATIARVDEPLPMADSLVYAAARRFGATLVTGDSDFEGLPDTVVVR